MQTTMLASVPIRENLKAVMKAKNISQDKLAEMCQERGETIRQKDLSEFLNEKQNFSANKLDVIAEVLDCDLNFIPRK